MVRYVDIDKAIEEARLAYCKDCNNYSGARCRACAFDDAMLQIEDAPTADVAEVKHGEWVIKSETIQLFEEVDEELYVECPFCKRTFYVPFEFEDEKIIAYAKKHYPYCNCGAKMKGDEQ